MYTDRQTVRQTHVYAHAERERDRETERQRDRERVDVIEDQAPCNTSCVRNIENHKLSSTVKCRLLLEVVIVMKSTLKNLLDPFTIIIGSDD